MSVWLDTRMRSPGEIRVEVEYVTLHEALHALAAMHHRPSPISVMSVHSALRLREMTDSDEALLRLYAHPLVRPGMTMEEVEELIVFANDLRDPPPAAAEENSVRIAERAYAALLEADSARFRVRGGWGGQSGCRDATFNGRYAIGDLGYGFPAVVRLDSNSRGFIFRYSESVGWRYWRQRASEWRGTSISAISDVTNWRNGFTDPADMLINVISYADPGAIEVTRPSPGEATLKVTLTGVEALQPSWARSVTLRISHHAQHTNLRDLAVRDALAVRRRQPGCLLLLRCPRNGKRVRHRDTHPRNDCRRQAPSPLRREGEDEGVREEA